MFDKETADRLAELFEELAKELAEDIVSQANHSSDDTWYSFPSTEDKKTRVSRLLQGLPEEETEEELFEELVEEPPPVVPQGHGRVVQRAQPRGRVTNFEGDEDVEG